MSPFEIRDARPEDAAAILAHSREVLADPDAYFITRPDELDLTVDLEQAFIEEQTRHETSRFLVAVAEQDGAPRLVGILMSRGALRRRERHVSTVGISVSAACRDRGVGRALLQECVDWARANPALCRLQLNVFEENVRAVHLYESLGFVVEGRRALAYRRAGRFHTALTMAMTFPSP